MKATFISLLWLGILTIFENELMEFCSHKKMTKEM
jgi:hypothetical protein